MGRVATAPSVEQKGLTMCPQCYSDDTSIALWGGVEAQCYNCLCEWEEDEVEASYSASAPASYSASTPASTPASTQETLLSLWAKVSIVLVVGIILSGLLLG